MITFTDEKSFVKAARFMDWYCINDPVLWVNLEQYLVKKENIFSAKAVISILAHFASQQEGSRDLYDFVEFWYRSNKFDKCSTHDLITLVYSFY